MAMLPSGLPSAQPPGAARGALLDRGSYARTVVLMDTFVSIQVVGESATAACEAACEERVERAFAWFRRVEELCSRFDPHSEVMRLAERVGVPTPVSAILYEAIAFALAVARASGGAFDPTVGHALERRGFNRHYRTGEVIASRIAPD